MALEFMDKEEWIKSRTDNPDSLKNKDWEAVYNDNVSLYTTEVTTGGVTEI